MQRDKITIVEKFILQNGNRGLNSRWDDLARANRVLGRDAWQENRLDNRCDDGLIEREEKKV